MSEPSVWSRSVPLVTDGDAVNAAHTNPPSQVLADRTSALKAILDAITAGEQLVVRDMPVTADVLEGHVVYLNLETLKHGKAQALYSSLNSTNGRLFPDDKAVYTGVVVSKTSTYAADVLLSGYGTIDAAAILRLFGAAAPDYGIYYLSALNPGQVQTTAPDMAVRVLQYVAEGVLRVFQPEFEPETHTHRQYHLYAGDWQVISYFDESIRPAGATYGYDLNTVRSRQQLLGESLLPAVGEGTFVWKYAVNESSSGSSSSSGTAGTAGSTALSGKHVNDSLIVLNADGIWWFGEDAPPQDIELTITVADTKGASLINTISSRTPNALTVSVVNGRAFLTMNEYTREGAADGYQVVKGIDVAARKLLVGPVVEKIVVGVGMRMSPASGQGTVAIERTEFADFPIVADLVNLDNAVTRTEDPLVFVEFPQNRDSKAYLKASIPYLFDATAFEIIIWARFHGQGTIIAGMDVEATGLPKPTLAGVSLVTITGYPANLPDIPGGTKYYELESPVAIDADDFSQGEIYYSLGVSSPVAAVKLLSTGIRLQLKS